MNCIFRQKEYNAVTRLSYNYGSHIGNEYRFEICTDNEGELIEDKLIVKKDVSERLDIKVGTKIFLDELQRSVRITDISFMPNGDKVLYVENKTNKDECFKEEQLNFLNGLINRLEILIKLNNHTVILDEYNKVVKCESIVDKMNIFKKIFNINI